MRLLKILAVLALLAVGGIAVLLGLMWIDHNRDTTLPTPTGPFAVGRNAVRLERPRASGATGPARYQAGDSRLDLVSRSFATTVTTG